MLPPISKYSTGQALGNSNNAIASAGNGGASLDMNKRHGQPQIGTKDTKQNIVRGDFSPDHSGYVTERICALERENDIFRDELLHLRQLLSNNHQQREDERLSLAKVSDDIQRLSISFNAKLQADSLFQQREQHKAALLFAEVSRLGHAVEATESTTNTLSGEVRRRLDAHEQQLQVSANSFLSKQHHIASQPQSPHENHELRQQLEELQLSTTLLKNQMNQIRLEIETDRNNQWRTDTERNQWVSDLRAAIAKNDSMIDAKINVHIERLNGKLMTDRMDLMRLLEEHRELISGTDFKRISSQMMEFSRINDHLQALERWAHAEFGHIKRIFQYIISETDGRFQAILLEVITYMKHWNNLVGHQDDSFRLWLEDLQDAVQEASSGMQKKLVALEEVLPMEVKARQQSDDKLRKRVESVLKSLSRAIETAREECVSPLEQLRSRMANVEQTQRQILVQVEEKQQTLRDAVESFTKESEAKVAELSSYIEEERQKATTQISSMASSNDTVAPEATGAEPIERSDVSDAFVQSDEALASFSSDKGENDQKITDDTPSPPGGSELTSYCDSSISVQPQDLSSMPVLVCQDKHDDITAKFEGVQYEQKRAMETLQMWTTHHAEECRHFCDYMHWSVDNVGRDFIVYQCLSAAIDQIVDQDSINQLQVVQDNLAWAIEQLVFTQQELAQVRRAGGADATETAVLDLSNQDKSDGRETDYPAALMKVGDTISQGDDEYQLPTNPTFEVEDSNLMDDGQSVEEDGWL